MGENTNYVAPDEIARQTECAVEPYFVEINDKRFDVIIHRIGSSIIVEFEVILAWSKGLVPSLNGAIRRISATNTEFDER